MRVCTNHANKADLKTVGSVAASVMVPRTCARSLDTVQAPAAQAYSCQPLHNRYPVHKSHDPIISDCVLGFKQTKSNTFCIRFRGSNETGGTPSVLDSGFQTNCTELQIYDYCLLCFMELPILCFLDCINSGLLDSGNKNRFGNFPDFVRGILRFVR